MSQIKLLDQIQNTALQQANNESADPFRKMMTIGKDKKGQTSRINDDFGSNQFTFDKVYTHEHYNADVYQDMCQPVVQKCLDGYNGTIFAYG